MEYQELDIAVGLIRHRDGDILRWLVGWRPKLEYYDFTIADRLEGESAREAVTREVAWQYGLDREREFLVSNMAQLNLEQAETMPGDFVPTLVRAAFYNVELYRRSGLDRIRRRPDCEWLSSQQIWEETASDGRPINPLMVHLIKRSQVIRQWESTSEGR